MRTVKTFGICLGLMFGVGACTGTDFQGSAGKKSNSKADKKDDGENKDTPKQNDDSEDGDDTLDGNDVDIDVDSSEDGLKEAEDSGLEEEEIFPEGGDSIKVFRCSTDYTVPGSANPYFAGSPSTASIDYTGKIGKGNKVDTATNSAPVEVTPTTPGCLKEGARLYFKVGGAVTHGSGQATSGADGTGVTDHLMDAQHGKSDILAPMNSLLAVFVGAGDPASDPVPAKLAFDTTDKKDYKKLSPKLNQIFFIGDGKAGDKDQLVIVPKGAKRLYFGVMDSGQWNNNGGSFTGAILWRP